MRWSNLLFLHWPVPVEAMRAAVPSELEIDTFDGTAWIALVPFLMEDTSFRGVPKLPGMSTFYECNVRTYVRARNADGDLVSGVWFFSLDAEHLLPVLGARWMWSLNYLHSTFTVTSMDGVNDYSLHRRANPQQRTHVMWHRGEELPIAEPGSIEHFLTERYWLFSKRRGRIMGGRVFHEPWPLRTAKVEHLDDTLIASAGFETAFKAGVEPMALHADTLKVDGWKLKAMSAVRTELS